MEDSIALWWRQFQHAAPKLAACFSNGEEFDVPGWMNATLGSVHPRLFWEFGRALQEPGHRLVITPESRRDLRPLVRELLRRAPRIRGWEFYEFRLPEDMEDAAACVKGRTGAELEKLRFIAAPNDSGQVDVTFYGPNAWDIQLTHNAGFVACESVVGEEILDCWIGVIDAKESFEAPANALPIARLADAVHSFISRLLSVLPAEPWLRVNLEQAQWSCLELKPENAEDYLFQDDLLVAVTPAPEFLTAALSRNNFDSRRHSRCGESFCYLKIFGGDGLDQSEFTDRGEIEDALNAVRPVGLGCAIGGGTGLLYSYIELALTDVDRAWEAMSIRLSQGRLPKRTWLLFHEAYYVSQWYGLYDDTPPPPLPDFEE